MLRITEIFFSIQGEARYSGLPTVFVRLTGCPMRCRYCDSAYAFHGGQKRSINDVISDIQQYQTKHITVTGGEPLAQPECLELLSSLCDLGYIVSIETGNAVSIAKVDPRVHVVLDIKTPESGEEANNCYENLELIQAKDQLKFVICSRDDFEWSRDFVLNHGLLDKVEVLFSPSADDIKPVDLAKWILADQLSVRFQTQLHKQLWGDIPGV